MAATGGGCRLRRRADPCDGRQEHSIPRRHRPHRRTHRRTPTRAVLFQRSRAPRRSRIRQRFIVSGDRQSHSPDSARRSDPSGGGRAALGQQARRLCLSNPARRIADHRRRPLSRPRRRATARRARRDRRSARIGLLHSFPGQSGARPAELPAMPLRIGLYGRHRRAVSEEVAPGPGRRPTNGNPATTTPMTASMTRRPRIGVLSPCSGSVSQDHNIHHSHASSRESRRVLHRRMNLGNLVCFVPSGGFWLSRRTQRDTRGGARV